MLTIRAESITDYAAVYEMHSLAFGRPNEAKLVEDIRHSVNFNPQLSMVAVQDELVVGHLLFSPLVIETKTKEIPALVLSPLAVHPKYQKQGIGSKLVRHGLILCKNAGYKAVIVIGYPSYYPRFGFLPASTKGIKAPFPVPDKAFMVLELVPGILNQTSGLIKFPAPFNVV
jgi:putative acetyltransferase